MSWWRCALAAGLLAAPVARAEQPARAEVKMEEVGKTYLFDYGQLVIEVRYLAPDKLQWEQVKGPEAGLKAVETYGFTAVRPRVYFIWWQEKDTSIVTQVADFEKRRVYTTWTSPDKKLSAFEGAIRPKE
jgi:hypothetical protein